MNSSESNDISTSGIPRKKNPFGRRSAGGIAVVVLLAIYSFAQPKLNERFGLNLPGLRQNSRGQVVTDKSDNRTQPSASPTSTDSNRRDPLKSGPLSDLMSPTKSGRDATTPRSSGAPSTPSADAADGDLLYGILQDTGNKRYVSPAGLLYTPGSAEGHRLEHLRRHTKDDTSRPVHGVFDNGMEGALKTIDRAYDRAKKNQSTTKSVDRNRTIYKVDVGSPIGFVGGQKGKRNRNPKTRRVQLVLEGNRVITAYPL